MGVIGSADVGAGVRDLLARHGHAGPPPHWSQTCDVADALRADGLVLLLAGDVTVPEDALQELVAVATSNPRIAALGPVSNVAPAAQRVGSQSVRGSAAAATASKRRKRHAGRWTAEARLAEFCLLLDAAAVRAAGGLSETASIEDALTDLFDRLRNAGAVVACARGAWVHRREPSEARLPADATVG